MYIYADSTLPIAYLNQKLRILILFLVLSLHVASCFCPYISFELYKILDELISLNLINQKEMLMPFDIGYQLSWLLKF